MTKTPPSFIIKTDKTTVSFAVQLHRTRLDYLLEWATMAKRKPIIIRGARQVGKSTLVTMLAQKLNFHLYVVNFEKNPQIAELFASNKPQEIIESLALEFQETIVPGISILFLDEIQNAPQVISSLRYFYEEMPELHVIGAGSLLEFALINMEYSIPVGRIEYMYMAPLTFEEFLLALNEKESCEYLQNYELNKEIPEFLHEKFMNLLVKYYIVGGMPEVVASYAENRDFKLVERIKSSILETFQNDFSKYTKSNNLSTLHKTFNKASIQIGKKFTYAHVDIAIKSNLIANALDQLCLARITQKVFHTSANGLPLGAEIKEKQFKIIFLDIGLVNTLLGFSPSGLNLTQYNSLNLVNQGALAEQIIGQELLCLSPAYENPKLYYWAREKKGSDAEIDYIISLNNKIIPIEVKSGKSGTLKSLHTFLNEKGLDIALRFNTNTPSIHESTVTITHDKTLTFKLISLPLYLAGQSYRLMQSVI